MGRYYDDELYHHGIKGQRWGVRRFQNPDGSLKAAGYKRYGVNNQGKSNGETNKSSNKSNRNENIHETIRQKDKQINKAHENHDRIIAKARQSGKSAAEIEQEENPGTAGRHLSDNQKKALAIGAGVTVAALATYGAYKYSKTRRNQNETIHSVLSETARSSGKTDFLKNAFADKGNFVACKNSAENKKVLNDMLTPHSSQWWKSLSHAEQSAVEKYSGFSYTKMNNALWAAKGDDITKYTDHSTAKSILDANKALKKASFPHDMVCTQGLSTENACKFLGCSPNDLVKAAKDPSFASKFIGNVNTNHGLFSTTSTADGGFPGGVKYSVFTPKGAHAAYIEHVSHYGDLPHPPKWNGKKSGGPPFSSEFETLFAAGSKFKTRGIHYNEKGYIEVALEYILDD